MFLRRVASHPELSADRLFGEFLRHEASWRDDHNMGGILHRADSMLRIFNASLRLKNPDKEFEEVKRYSTELKTNLTNFLRSRARLVDATLDFHALHQQYGQVLSELSHRDGPGGRGDRLQAAGQFMDRLSQAALPFLEEQEEAADRLKEYLAYADALFDVATSPDLTDSQIVAAVVPRAVEDDKNDSDDIESDPDPSPSLTAVADAGAVMRAFARKKGLMVRLACSLSEFEEAVVAARLLRRQLTLTDFCGASSQGLVSRLLHSSSTPEQKTQALEQQLHSLNAEIQAATREKQEFSEKALAEIAKFREQKERDLTHALSIFVSTNIRLCRESIAIWERVCQCFEEMCLLEDGSIPTSDNASSPAVDKSLPLPNALAASAEEVRCEQPGTNSNVH
ncbi:hypothetical protein HPB50_017719 [Hyalomma asiaticum]|uniref:Uncharacterized protein n=1 Tax=Hyalomma asiaticum TaxID=266040 RepID=A0ACB7SZL0_HYAAI|nr:hypothetical protein HPB50_017719 [Hyalomma asiaticum]